MYLVSFICLIDMVFLHLLPSFVLASEYSSSNLSFNILSAHNLCVRWHQGGPAASKARINDLQIKGKRYGMTQRPPTPYQVNLQGTKQIRITFFACVTAVEAR